MIGLWRRESPLWKLAWAHRLMGGGGEPVWATAAGNPVTISAMAAPLQALRVDFSPVQAGSGTPSPDNVRPISGWTGMTALLNGREVSASWESYAGTVYGGYVDLITGEMVVNRGFVTVDGDTYKISGKANTTQTDRVRFYTATNSIPNLNYGSGKEAELIVSNMLGVPNGESDSADYAPPLICAGMYNAQFYVSFPLSYGLTTVAEANAWFAEHPTQVSYILRTPEHIQLSPQTIRTIRGSNTISTDGDNVTVTYVEAWQ